MCKYKTSMVTHNYTEKIEVLENGDNIRQSNYLIAEIEHKI